jgi:lipoate-protein ligase A
MAIDEALMRRARRTGEAVLRVYGWRTPTLSLGRHQTARGRYDLARAAAAGVTFVRRPTGGRAVLHHREVTYSVTAPVALAGSLRESYAWINRLLLMGLQSLGVDAHVVDHGGPSPAPGVSPCFETPVAGEITAAGRKLVGSAQWRDDEVLLQHGSILIDDDQTLATTLLLQPVQVSPAPATLRSLLGNAPSLEDVHDALRRSLATLAQLEVSPLSTDAAFDSDVDELRRHYGDDSWTWRR